jgi:ferric-dicitrate binding protein FerR (iron transport regulator)
MNNQEIIELLNRYDQGECTEQEKAWIETWYVNQQTETIHHPVEELVKDLAEVEQSLITHTTHRRITMWPRIAAAASILLFLSVGGYFLLHKQAVPVQVVHNEIHNDVPPGTNKAIITLANGKQVSLTDAKNGIISKQGNQLIKKTSNGTIAYESDNSDAENQRSTYNVITTPRGGQWSVVLPDGTKVMLDAASSIKYPLSFGNERIVEITGQVYFEVVHNAARPFRIIAKDQVIEDIGTKFNINAYDDEPLTNTTLLEGAVKVSAPKASSLADRNGITLKPGQQAVVQDNKLTVSNADMEEALAWRNGYFKFNDEKLVSIMRKLSRWYDIKVEYKGDSPDVVFDGDIPRNTSLVQVLKVLEVANVHFTVDGKKLIVTQ